MGTLNLNTGGVVKADNYQLSTGQELGKCYAWVNFNGTGTVAIRKAVNVSSVTDNGVGDYTLNFSTPLPDNTYCPVCMSTGVPLDDGGVAASPKAVGAFRFSTFNLAGTARTDYANVTLAIFD